MTLLSSHLFRNITPEIFPLSLSCIINFPLLLNDFHQHTAQRLPSFFKILLLTTLPSSTLPHFIAPLFSKTLQKICLRFLSLIPLLSFSFQRAFHLSDHHRDCSLLDVKNTWHRGSEWATRPQCVKCHVYSPDYHKRTENGFGGGTSFQQEKRMMKEMWKMDILVLILVCYFLGCV